jgi:RNA polymerase sigma-70 factor, ECF subfamily
MSKDSPKVLICVILSEDFRFNRQGGVVGETSDEQAWVDQARTGDEKAVTLLYETHVGSIFAYMKYRVDSTVAAEDLTAEVFLRMVRSLPTYESRGLPFRAWLFRIAANLLTDHYRQLCKNTSLPITEDFASDDTDPFDNLIKKEQHIHLRRAIRNLSEEYQNLLILRFVEDLSHTEIATVLNKSPEALRAMQYRALKALAIELERLVQQGGSNER